ncbi:MAG: hemerythrin domain-containing protein [Deltaproteobacteria bacterium]|nr:hemerythrin domain-containing protein [Deltaproteobacteria bacterium]
MDALELLIEQHDKVDDLIAQLEDDGLEPMKKATVFRELADNLAAHASMEEKLFYPAVRAKQTEEILLESTEEHLAIKRVLADLLETRLDDERFSAKLSVLKEEVEHHAREEEEDKLFPKVRQFFDKEELIALGSEMMALFQALMTTEPRKDVPGQTRKAARL